MANELITLEKAAKPLADSINKMIEACQSNEDREALCRALESLFFVKIERKGFTDQKVSG